MPDNRMTSMEIYAMDDGNSPGAASDSFTSSKISMLSKAEIEEIQMQLHQNEILGM